MKTPKLLFLTCFFLFCKALSAQSFYNGSLEPIVGSSVIECADNSYAGINSVGSVYMSVIGPQEMFMADNTCGIGFAKDGSHYIGLHYSPTLYKGNQLLLELNSDMKAGKSYVFSFYYKGPSPKVGTGANLYYGYSINDTTVDTSASVFVIAPSDTVWRRVTGTVTPSLDCRYIWVGAAPATGTINDSATTYVDYFVFNPPNNVDVVNKNTFSLYPQPLRTSVTLDLGEDISLPCTLSLYDISGHLIRQQQLTTSHTILDRGTLASGMYFMQLKDRSAMMYATKLLVE